MRKSRFVALASRFCLLALLVAPIAAQETTKKEFKPEETPTISVDELILMMANKKPVVVIDVRHLDAYSEKIKGALQIPVDEIEARLKEIPRTKEIVLYCACPTEATSNAAAVKLFQNGYKKVRALKGGWNRWVQAAGPTEQKQ